MIKMFSKKLKETGERLISGENFENSPCYLRHRAAYVFAEQFIKGKTVLEDGCGSGYGAYYLITKGAKKVIGIDISQQAVDYAGEKYSNDNIEFNVMSVTELGFEDETFDVVTSFQVIEHLKEPQKYLSEIKRVSKNNAVILISTPNKKTYSPNSIEPENPFHVKEYYLEEFTDLIKSYFDDFEIFGVNHSQRIEQLKKSLNYRLRARIRNILRKIRLDFLLNLIPKNIKFYLSKRLNKNVNISDFSVNKNTLENCLDFIAVCKK
jgi:ubiquinone/menaquinone biosynthesis C-methylase UbiE